MLPQHPPSSPKQDAGASEPNALPTERVDNIGMPLPSNPQTFFLGSLLALAVLAAVYVASPIILPVVLAFVLQLILQPAVRLLERVHLPRAVGPLLAILLVIGALVGFVAALSVPAATWAEKLPEGIPRLETHTHGRPEAANRSAAKGHPTGRARRRCSREKRLHRFGSPRSRSYRRALCVKGRRNLSSSSSPTVSSRAENSEGDAFDLVCLNGRDLRKLLLFERKAHLKSLSRGTCIQFTERCWCVQPCRRTHRSWAPRHVTKTGFAKPLLAAPTSPRSTPTR